MSVTATSVLRSNIIVKDTREGGPIRNPGGVTGTDSGDKRGIDVYIVGSSATLATALDHNSATQASLQLGSGVAEPARAVTASNFAGRSELHIQPLTIRAFFALNSSVTTANGQVLQAGDVGVWSITDSANVFLCVSSTNDIRILEF